MTLQLPASRQSVVHLDGIPRRVVLDKASNLRDLGGFETDYGTTKFGQLFRADQLGLLTSEDILVITQELGIVHVVDLRGHDELDIAGKGPLAEHSDVDYYNIPVSEKALVTLKNQGSKRNRNLPVSQRYFRRLTHNADSFRDILTHLIEHPVPTVFNCVAGRDRTGLVAMLILGAAGVRAADIADDYAATVRIPEDELGRSRDPKLMEFWKDYVKAVGTTHLESPEDMSAAMLELLEMLDEDYGGIEGYLKFLGVSAEKLRGLLT